MRVVGGFTKHQLAEKRLPTVDELIAVAPDTPVFLLHLYDRAILNGAALRTEGEAYGRKLSNAGVRVTLVRYNGTIHDFVMLNALADPPATRGAIAQAVGALRGALG